MLEFNPYLRKSAEELIKLPYFDDIRDSDKEEVSPPNKVSIPLDRGGIFDYQTYTFKSFQLEDLQ